MAALCSNQQGLFRDPEQVTMSRPIRVAVVGSGPAGLYSVEHLLEKRGLDVEIDLYERLPTPWGLVRSGVAPDHPEKKLVIDRQFTYFLKNPRVRFIGNVEIGRDIRYAELAEWYDAVVYSVGAASDTRMGIPGEELSGCWAAREFVGFYNGHPDYSHLKFDLSCERAIVVGNGNVALDVARILTMPVSELESTDIADHALEVLRKSRIREVVILGRRGHMQGAFNNPELEELEHLNGVDVVIDGEDVPGEHEVVMDDADWETLRKVRTLRRLVTRTPTAGNKRIVFRFLTSPVELLGSSRVEQVLVIRNHLERDDDGKLNARPTEEESILDAGLVLRAIGYRGTPFPGLPFDERRGVIQNCHGRVSLNEEIITGTYVTGWIKRGCRGIIGSNKKCSGETISCLFEDLDNGRLQQPRMGRDGVMAIVRQRKPDVVLRDGWLSIDHKEREAGRRHKRPRIKLTAMESLLRCAFEDRMGDRRVEDLS
jgi:ferredoxin--NADP+ reductase